MYLKVIIVSKGRKKNRVSRCVDETHPCPCPRLLPLPSPSLPDTVGVGATAVGVVAMAAVLKHQFCICEREGAL